MNIFIPENKFENVVCDKLAILFHSVQFSNFLLSLWGGSRGVGHCSMFFSRNSGVAPLQGLQVVRKNDGSVWCFSSSSKYLKEGERFS